MPQIQTEREACLLARAKSNAPDLRSQAEGDLISLLRPEVQALIRSLSLPPWFTLDEAMASANYALVLAIRRFDPGRGVKLWTFARQYVRGQVLRDADKLRPVGPSLDDVPDRAVECPELAAIDTRLLAEAMLGSARPKERRVLTLRYIDSLAGCDIAVVLGLTASAVTMIETRARKRLAMVHRDSA